MTIFWSMREATTKLIIFIVNDNRKMFKCQVLILIYFYIQVAAR